MRHLMKEIKFTKDPNERKEIGIAIGNLKKEMEFNAPSQSSDISIVPNTDVVFTNDNDGICGLFELSDDAPQLNTVSQYNIMDLSCKWTGPMPTDLLSQWIKKNRKRTLMTYYPVTTYENGFRAGIRLVDGEYFEMEPSELTTTKQDAKHYIATKALFQLSKSHSLEQRLAPVYRDLWSKWQYEVDSKVRLADEAEYEKAYRVVERVRNASGPSIEITEAANGKTESQIQQKNLNSTYSRITPEIQSDWMDRLESESYKTLLVIFHVI